MGGRERSMPMGGRSLYEMGNHLKHCLKNFGQSRILPFMIRAWTRSKWSAGQVQGCSASSTSNLKSKINTGLIFVDTKVIHLNVGRYPTIVSISSWGLVFKCVEDLPAWLNRT